MPTTSQQGRLRPIPINIFSQTDPQTSERKWKDKLKEWKFEKNISAADMNVLVTKCGKRKRDEGKDTTFFHMGKEIKLEKLENFKKRKSTKTMEVVSSTAGTSYLGTQVSYQNHTNSEIGTPANITYCTPGPQTPFLPLDIEANSTSDEDTAQIERFDHLAIAEDPWIRDTSTRETFRESSYISEGEIPTFLPPPSNQSGERRLLIDNIPPNSMLWNCPGRGLHTMDEESVFGADDEWLAPFLLSDLIQEHITGARIDAENYRTKSAVVKYLGATTLLLERECCSQDILLEYFSEFLDILEAGPGAFVSILQQSSAKPVFRMSEYSDVFILYHEVLTLLRTEFQPTTQVVARICILLADLETLYPETSHHADVLYGVAIQGYEAMGDHDNLFQCQLSHANVLIDLNRTSDAYELLARASSKYLRDHLGGWDDLNPNSTTYTLESLFPASPGVQPSIFRIKHILSQHMESKSKNGDESELYIMMLHEVASLGGVLGGIRSIEASRGEIGVHLETLGPLWSEIFRKLVMLDDRTFGLLKAFTYIQRSNYLSDGVNSGHKVVNDVVNDIFTAHRYLSDGGHLRAGMQDQFVQHVEGLRLRGMNLPRLDLVDMMDIFSLAGMSRDPIEVFSPCLSASSELQCFAKETTKEVDDVVDGSVSSRRYGVKYNDSSRKGLCFID
jgi:hypothetical protein